jgi:hypothetical protein
MALTDPILTTNEAVTNSARETLRIHQALIDEIGEMLPLNEARWRCERKYNSTRFNIPTR